MAPKELTGYMDVVAAVMRTDRTSMWSSYDKEADVLYLNFKRPSHATDSELTDDDVIIRYEGQDVVGLTILRVSQR